MRRLLALSLLVIAIGYTWAVEHQLTDVNGRQTVDAGWKEKQGGITIVALSGDDYSRGFQHGMLLQKEYAGMLENIYKTASVRMMLEKTGATAGPTGPKLSPMTAMVIRPMTRFVPQDVLAELQGLADGLAGQWHGGADFLPLLVWNLGPDLLGINGLCSSVVVTPERGGETMLARNLDMEFWGGWDRYRTLFVIKPEKGYAHLSLGWPGLVGVCSGMNEKGLALVYHIVPTKDKSAEGMPIWMLNRKMLMQAPTVDDAIKLMTTEKRMGGGSIVVTADAGGKAAVLELTANNNYERYPEKGLLIASNHYFGSATKDVSYNPTRSSRLRYDRMLALSPTPGGPVGPVEMLKPLRDNFDPELKYDDPLGDMQGWDINMQSMIFAPGKLRVWMADGEASAVQHRFLGFEYDPKANTVVSKSDLTIPANERYSTATIKAVAAIHTATDTLDVDAKASLVAASEATAERPDLARTWVARAWAELYTSDFRAASNSLNKAEELVLVPWLKWDIKYIKGMLLVKEGKIEEGKKLLQEVEKDGYGNISDKAKEALKSLP